MSDTADLPVPPPPSGYLSKEAKDWYTLLVIVLSIVFFLLMIILPIVIIMPYEVSAASQMQFAPVLHVDDAVVWQGKLWMVREPMRRVGPRSTPFGGSPSGPPAATLVSWDSAKDDSPTEAASLAMVHPRPLADGDRLWLISRDNVATYQAGAAPTEPVYAYLTNPARPFLCDGRPAVVDFLSDGPMLRELKDQQWEDTASLTLDLPPGPAVRPDDLRVIPAGGVYYVLARVGDALYCRAGLGRPGERVGKWEQVATAPGVWTATILDDRPVVFYYEETASVQSITLVGLRHDTDGWRRFSTTISDSPMEMVAAMPASAGLRVGLSLYVWPVTGGDFHALFYQDYAGVLAIEVKGDTATRRQVNLGRMALPPKFMIIGLLAYGLPLLLSLAMAVILSILVARYRVRIFDGDGVVVAFAPLWRRGVAAIIDFTVVVGPVAAFAWLFPRTHDFTDMGNTEPWFYGVSSKPPVALLCGGVPWMLGVFLLFCFTEGRWGVTVGKWLLGIRVRRDNLQPCGFVRALVRNLLRIADCLFGYLVGLTAAALTDQFQRLGDLAAGTVVVSARAWPPPPEYVSPDLPSSRS